MARIQQLPATLVNQIAAGKVVERPIVRADRALLFDLTQDYARRLAWDVYLTEARLLGDDPRPAPGV